MKKVLCTLLALAFCGVAYGAQDTDILPIEVRNPKLLEIWLEANATDAESRLTSGATNSTHLILGNTAEGETAYIDMEADQGDDAGDNWRIVASDSAGLLLQSDATVKGTVATKVTIGVSGAITAADAITLTDADGVGTVTVTGYQASDARIILDADEGDDNADTWTIESEATGNDLSVMNHTTEVLNLTSAGALSVDAGVAAGDAITLTDADTNAVISAIGYESSDASLVLDADQGDDNADTWTIKSEASGNDLSILNHTTEVLNLTSAGNLQVDGSFALADALTLTDGDGAASVSAIAASGAYDATLTLDADAGEDNADTWILESEAADNDLSFVNHATERAKLTAAGALHVDTINELGTSGIAVEGYTIDDGTLTDTNGTATIQTVEADDVDTITAVALEVGKDAATSVVIADSGVDTDIEGPLNLEQTLVLDNSAIANAAGVFTQTVAAAAYTLEPSAVNTQTFAAATSGTLVWIKNNAATNVVIDVGAGDVTLGDNDCVLLGYLGSEWITLATKDN